MTITTKIEKAFGADLTANPASWVYTDVSAYALGEVTVTPGRPDEASTTTPTRCTFRLKNTDSRFSPRHPSSPLYPNVRRQTPVRVSLNPGTGYVVRFQGYVDEIVPSWPSGNSDYAEVQVLASGSLRRLLQGNNPLRSPLTRAALGAASAGLRQFWPGEDGANSSQMASAISGQPPLTGTAALFAAVNPVTIENLPYGTQPIADFKNGAKLSATFAAGSASSWTVQIGAACYDFSGVVTTIAEWATPGGTFVRWQVVKDTTGGTFGTRLIGYSAAGAPTTICSSAFVSSAFGECTVTAAQSGGNINVTMYVALDTVSGSPAGTLAGVSGFTINPTSQATTASFGVGQVRIWDGITAPRFQTTSFAPGSPNSAWWSFVNEALTDRMTRLCVEEAVPFVLTGASAVAMPPQGISTFLSLMRACETADLGILYDGAGPGLAYLARSARYNLPVSMALDTRRQQVKLPFAPAEDDQRIRNDWTVSRSGGSSVRYTDPMHIAANGVYDSSIALDIQSDADLRNQAAWRVHLGTVDEMRVPGLSLQLIDRPELWAAWFATMIGERITAANLPAQYPPGILDMIVEGYTETWNSSSWKVDLNTSPYRPWQVGALNQTFRLEMAGQTLAANLAPGATTLSLATAAGHQLHTLKATYPNDFPPNNELVLGVAGWPIRVKDATGAGSPQTLTIDPAPNTVTIPAGTPITQWRPASLAL